MRNSQFDPNNICSLPDPGYEVRDHLSELAVAIVSARYDLVHEEYEEIIRLFDSTLRDLHDAYDRMGPPETFDP
jgi:hypothetical protein